NRPSLRAVVEFIHACWRRMRIRGAPFPMSSFNITVNGKARDIEAQPQMPLLYALRNDLQLNGPKFGCGLGQCGACTVHIGGAAVRSCVTPISSVGKAEI